MRGSSGSLLIIGQLLSERCEGTGEMSADGARTAAHQVGALVEREAVVIVQPDDRPLMPGQSTKGAIEVRVGCLGWPLVTIPLADRHQAEQPALDAETAPNTNLLQPGVQP